MAPYIITTRVDTPVRSLECRRAVATLEEVRNLPEVEGWDTARCTACGHFRDEHASGWCAGCDNGGREPICREWKPDPLAEPFLALPESGGTVGPFPDGTVIEVAPAQPGELRRACPLIFSSDWVRMSDHERVAAYNAAKEGS